MNLNCWGYYSRYFAFTFRGTENFIRPKPGTGIQFSGSNAAFGSYHVGGAQFVFGDGQGRVPALEKSFPPAGLPRPVGPGTAANRTSPCKPA